MLLQPGLAEVVLSVTKIKIEDSCCRRLAGLYWTARENRSTVCDLSISTKWHMDKHQAALRHLETSKKSECENGTTTFLKQQLVSSSNQWCLRGLLLCCLLCFCFSVSAVHHSKHVLTTKCHLECALWKVILTLLQTTLSFPKLEYLGKD